MSNSLTRYSNLNPVKSYFAIRKEPIRFLAHLQSEEGDFAAFNILGLNYCLVNDPSLIREALIEKSESFVIQGGASAGLAKLIGRGILTNRGNDWRQSRKSLQPLFQSSPMEAAQQIIEVRIGEMLERWYKELSGKSFSLNQELLMLSFQIKCSALFDYSPTIEESEKFANAIWTIQSEGMTRYMLGLDFLSWLPVPLNSRVNQAVKVLNEISKSIAVKSNLPADEISSLLFAGAESPANTLSWAIVLLNQNPDWLEKLRQNSESEFSETDLLSQTLNEVMRLYPAGWAFERYSPDDNLLGSHKIKKGTRLLFSPFLMHRNSKYWSEPEKFNPLRFAKGTTQAAGILPFTYIPFGAGPRSCIGSRLAMLEMRLVLKRLVQCPIVVKDQLQIEPSGSFKIRFKNPLHVFIRPE